jgi:hypothetical protein
MNCGIKKYDDLPGRVGWIDVDFLRWRLYVVQLPTKTFWQRIVKSVYMSGGINNKQKIINSLELARKEV